MKKILSVAASIALAAALISCGDTSDFDGATDTVLTLAAPKVTAKAYPGVNYITWEPIAGASSFELYRTEDGVAGSQAIALAATKDTAYADIAAANHVLADGKSYKYTVVAVSRSDPSRAVVVKSSQGSATVTAKVPTAGTNVKDFKDAKSYFDKFNEKNLSNNVKVSEVGGRIYAEYPATAGFSYTLVTLDDKEYEARGTAAVTGTSVTNYKEDYKAEYGTNDGTIKSFGKYSTFLKVESVSKLYEPTYITLESSREIKSIGELSGSVTTGKASEWKDASTVRIYWTPAKLKATNDYTPTTNYKVYRSSAADNTWTALTATVVDGGKRTNSTTTPVVTTDPKVYYIEDTVADNKIGYTYYIVHTDGTYYGAYSDNNNKVTVDAYEVKTTEVTATASVIKIGSSGATDNVENDIKVVVTKANEKQALKVSYVNLGVAADNTYFDVHKNEFTEITLANENKLNDSFIGYAKNVANGVYLIKTVASEAGKLDAVTYTTVTVAKYSVNTDDLSVSAAFDGTSTTNVKVTVVESAFTGNGDTSTDVIGNYTYALKKVTTTTNLISNKTQEVTVVSSDVKALDLSAGDGTTYSTKQYFQVADDKLDNRTATTSITTQYYVVKTHKVTQESTVVAATAIYNRSAN